jgi:hypothetical protein
MPEKKFTLTGWPTVVVVIALIGLFGYRVMSFRNLESNEKLVKEVQMLLQAEYLPGEVRNLKSMYESGNTEELEKAAQSLKATRINIESIEAGFPPLNFNSKQKKVVTRVVYSITGDSGVRQAGTKYYSFEHSPIGNTWHSGYEVTAISYYLNLF